MRKLSIVLLQLLVVGLIIVAVGCGEEESLTPAATATPTSMPAAAPTPSAAADRIVFASNRTGNHEIYVIDADGSNLDQLTSNPGALNIMPCWSPDRSKIVFVSTRDGNHEIYVMNADGTNQTRLTETPAENEGGPRWSPDGSRIAFSIRPPGQDPKICVMDADGSNQITVVGVKDMAQGIFSQVLGRNFSWSPDGQKLALWCIYPGRPQSNSPQIYTVNADGSGETKLTNIGPNISVGDAGPEWSPDGTRIAFAYSDDLTGKTQIWVVGTDGGSLTRLTDTGDFAHMEPSWSPDGSKIAFHSQEGGGRICVIDADGTKQVALTDSVSTQATWSPDGTKIAFVSLRDGNYDIYVMNADGSNQTRLMTDPGLDMGPHWGVYGWRW